MLAHYSISKATDALGKTFDYQFTYEHSAAARTELIALLKGAEFAHMMKPVAGYAPDSPGEVVTLDKVFPWRRRIPAPR